MARRRKKKLKQPVSSTERSRFSRNVKRLLIERSNNVNRLMQHQDTSNLTESTEMNDSLNLTANDNLKQNLISWINQNRIAKRAVNELLSILISAGHSSLPRDYRTLLRTPTNVEIIELAGGKFWYNGLSNSLQSIFRALKTNLKIQLSFNIDGLPLFNSSNRAFYPILGSIHGDYVLIMLQTYTMFE